MTLSPLLIALAIAFAISMGAHYTGACVGMPVAARVLSVDRALLLMAPLALVGAALASHRVEATVSQGILAHVDAASAAIILASALALTSIYNLLRIPTSTIQILVFCAAGAGVGRGLGVQWANIGRLAVVWVVAPLTACTLAFALTRLQAVVARSWGSPAAPAWAPNQTARLLILMGAAASLAMGANDVANASGPLLMAHLLNPLLAGLVGGVGLAAGALTWGRPLLRRVAVEVVALEPAMALIAKLVQAAVVLTPVLWLGYFTSMNQALIAAMAGTGLGRGRATIRWSVLGGILAGWALGPGTAFLTAFGANRVIALLAGR